MLRPLLLFTGILMLLQFPCQTVDYASATEPVQIADASSQQTELMKQSDYMQRVDEEKEQKETERQMASLGLVEAETRNTDRFVIVMLAISAVALILLSKRMTTSRRGRGRRLRTR